MNESLTKSISELHLQLATIEARISSKPVIVTGVQGVRIMRLVAMISGNAFRYALVRKRPAGRWC